MASPSTDTDPARAASQRRLQGPYTLELRNAQDSDWSICGARYRDKGPWTPNQLPQCLLPGQTLRISELQTPHLELELATDMGEPHRLVVDFKSPHLRLQLR